MDVLNPKLTATVSMFACRITDTIGGFILSCYNNNRVSGTDIRIHYEDCTPFNEEFDDSNPIRFGAVFVSASKALFEQDYEAYRESYLDYLYNLQLEIEQ